MKNMINTKKEYKLHKELSGKHVMITGGLGMIGSTVAQQLLKYKAKVTIVDLCLEPYGANMFNLEGVRDQVNVSITDIRDREAMKILVKGKDIIFNLAGQVSHNDSIEDPMLDCEINYVGQLNVMNNVMKYNPTTKMLFAGSRLQFGPIKTIPVDETHKLEPQTPYAFHKTATELMYKYFNEIHEIQTVVFRIANPYGPRSQMKHSKYSIVNYFIRQAMEGKNLKVFGDGNQLRDYIYVEDLANAFLLAAINEDANGQVFNVGSGVGTRFKDMVRTVVEVVGYSNIDYIPWPEKYLNVETGDYATDITKISRTLGWHPSVSLREGIKKTYSYYKRYKDYYF